MQDELRPEYDLRNLKVRKVGFGRKPSSSSVVQNLRSASDIKPLYMLPEDPLAEEVLIPGFQIADQVDCMAGFFSSEVLVSLAPGLATFINCSQGSFRLIISPFLRDEDRTAIEEGVSLPEEIVVTENFIEEHTLKCLVGLLSTGRIKIKIALMKDALFHPKVWLFHRDDDVLAAHGSSNVTYAGIRKNIEQVAVSKSWGDPDQRFTTEKFCDQFARLWENKDDSCVVIGMPQAIQERLLQTYRYNVPSIEADLRRLYERTTGLVAESSNRVSSIRESSMATFYGSGPGQDIDEIVDRLSVDELCTVLGEDVVPLIELLSNPDDRVAKLRKSAIDMLRNQADVLMARSDIREICFNATSSEKLTELAGRLGVTNVNAVRTLDPTENAKTWQKFLGFFGIDTRGAVPFATEPNQVGIRPEFGLFTHQRHAATRVWDVIGDGYERVVLHMPTGAGKTRTAMHIVSRFMTAYEPSVVVWLAASAELLDQAADAFKNTWSKLGNREIDILRFWGDYSPDLSGITDGLIIAGLQKMHAFKARDPLGFLRLAKSVKLVIVDEAHQAIAPTYKKIINSLAQTGQNTALVGLTATPGRTWSDIDTDEHLADFFGGRKVMLDVEGWDDSVSYLIEQGYLARPTFRRFDFKASSELKQHLSKARRGDDYDLVLLESIAEQEDRNVIIIDEIRRLIKDGHRRIILFGASVRHAELLSVVLSAVGIDGRVVTSNTGKTARKQIIDEFQDNSTTPMVLCNFGVLTTGFDAPNTSAAVIARPTKSLVLFSQMVGRATRGPKAGGNATCAISTVVDIDLAGFGNVAEAFTNWEDIWYESR